MASRNGPIRGGGGGKRNNFRWRDVAAVKKSSDICPHYRRGKCTFGGRCRFSHEPDAGRNASGMPAQSFQSSRDPCEDQNYRSTYNELHRFLRKRPEHMGLHEMKSLWDIALEILDSTDDNGKQMLPKDLDDDKDLNGYAHINALLTRQSEGAQLNVLLQAWRSFLLVITHTGIINCLSVDTYVGSLYNFISGSNGNRAVASFLYVCQAAMTAREAENTLVSIQELDTLSLALSTALSELLRREMRARFHEELPVLIASLEAAAKLMTGTDSEVASKLILRRVEDLRGRTARATAMLSTKSLSDQEEHLTHTSAYPCDTAEPGGRHDNDRRDIADISIFPTRDEILSGAEEFLPSTDPDQAHFLGDEVAGHIDTQYRLFRHDTFGGLKDTLGHLMTTIQNDRTQLQQPKLQFEDTRLYAYPHSHISSLVLDKRQGFQVHLSFLHPYQIRKKSREERQKWWEDTRRLQNGVLASFLWMEGCEVHNLFFTLVERIVEAESKTGSAQTSKVSTFAMRLVSNDKASIQMLTRLSRHKTTGLLLEFPSVLPATFVPVLEGLQNMQRNSRLPFRQWILPSRVAADASATSTPEIPSPMYAQSAGFHFPLTPILLNKEADLRAFSPSTPTDDDSFVTRLQTSTGLDSGQCLAFMEALSREFAMIQGPPGTGKSFLGVKLMQVILEVKKKSDLGPIVVVCYTNYALDQFLEHLIKAGISKVVRVGGQSRSKLLENHNLRNISRGERRTKHESWRLAKGYESLEECETSAKSSLGRVHSLVSRLEWKNFQHYLLRKYGRIHAQFRWVDSSGFKTVGRHPFDIWRMAASQSSRHGQIDQTTPTVEIDRILQKAMIDVQSLSPGERYVLLAHWVKELHEDAEEDFFEIVKEAESVQNTMRSIHQEVDRRVLQNADVIGLTTSGLAKSLSSLQHVHAKVILCEEAGEVLEPHILCTLLPYVEHFIQIGDHQQLRPTINNFQDLSLESSRGKPYQLDRSQFERLAVGQPGRCVIPVAQLNVQRRMRPEISELIRSTVYPRLADHSSVMELPSVVGMRHDIFWLDHENLEAGERPDLITNKSKSNDWEVAMVHALVRHIVRQGKYGSTEIAVLTPYTGQLQKLRAAMRNDFEICVSDRDEEALAKDGLDEDEHFEHKALPSSKNKRKLLEKTKLSDRLRVATVDNFQGEEAKIIIVSLVRSNQNCKVGFLRTENRINVLLSRAQHGMYLIGNSSTYSNIPMWQKVINMLRAKDHFGPALELCCPRHMETVIQVSQPDDFARYSPEGGCREACTDRLPDCGHRCQARCHSAAMHEVFNCEQPCSRKHEVCGHACQKPTCGEDCGKCKVVLNNVHLPCGHTQDNVFCYRTQDIKSIPCVELVRKLAPSCKHEISVPCCKELGEDFFCPVACEATLECGHPCPGSCGKCTKKSLEGGRVTEHVECSRVCGRPHSTCNHTCENLCHDGSNCGVCSWKCEVACKHSRCVLQCYEACAPCIETCTWSCPHQGQCLLPCSAPCERLPCNERCIKILPCGHQCPGLCGETCLAEYCAICGKQLDAQVDLIELKNYGEIDLDETPIVSLPCGHFFTAESLDGLVGLHDVYEFDAMTATFVGLKEISSTLAPRIPTCPLCKRPIRQYATQRYNRLINKAVIDEQTKRFITSGQEELHKMENKVLALEKHLDDTRSQVVNVVSGQARTAAHSKPALATTKDLKSRYSKAEKLQSLITHLQLQVSQRHQPAHKLHQATDYAMRQRQPLESMLANATLASPVNRVEQDYRVKLGAKMVEIKLKCILVEDKLNLVSAVRADLKDAVKSIVFSQGVSTKDRKRALDDCEKLIGECVDKALPRIGVEASIHYARIARLRNSDSSDTDDDCREKAKDLLENALKLCEKGFRDAEALSLAVKESLRLLQQEWYEVVTDEELKAIKTAMLMGSRGLATHSGHWYNCENGHPFAIGECGMPMQLARCPECGAAIGGQNHQAIAGVTRAIGMET